MIHRARLLLAFVAVLLVATTSSARDATMWETLTLAEGTRFETPVHIQETGRAGPTVVIVSGLHGDEPASAYAAEQIRHWPLRRGRVVVVPRGNVPALKAGKRLTPGASKALANANRNFPRTTEAKKAPARGELAQALWALLQQERPDWVLDLHEGVDVHKRNANSVGRTIIAGRDAKTDAVVTRMLVAVNATVSNEALQFERLTRPVDGGLARAAAHHLDMRTMIVETSKKGLAISTRAREHRILAHRFLDELDMLAPGIEPAEVGFRDGVEADTLIGVYDGGGVGGSGVRNLLRQLPELDDVAVARIGPTEIKAGALTGFDVVIFSGGMGGSQSRWLGETGRVNVKRFVDQGGGYVGICAGSYLACRGFSWGLGILDARTRSPKWKRGKATVQMQLTEAGRNTLVDRDEPFGVLYANGPIIEPAHDEDLPDFETLAVFRTEVARNGTPKGLMVDTPAVVRGRFGEGRVVCFSPHPEQTKGLHDLVLRAVAWLATEE